MAQKVVVTWDSLPGEHSRLAAMHVWTDKVKACTTPEDRMKILQRWRAGEISIIIRLDAFFAERAHLRKGGV